MQKSKWFLDRISIPGCEYLRRQPESDEWSPLPASTPPRGRPEPTDPWLQTFSWLEDRLSVFPNFDIDVYIDIWYPQTSIVTPGPDHPASSRSAAAPPWQIVVRLLAPKLDKWRRGGGHSHSLHTEQYLNICPNVSHAHTTHQIYITSYHINILFSFLCFIVSIMKTRDQYICHDQGTKN